MQTVDAGGPKTPLPGRKQPPAVDLTSDDLRAKLNAVRGTPQHGLSSNKMAPITSDCDAMRSLDIKWP